MMLRLCKSTSIFVCLLIRLVVSTSKSLQLEVQNLIDVMFITP